MTAVADRTPGSRLQLAYNDGLTLVLAPSTNDTALTAAGFVAKATWDGYVSTTGSWVNTTTGVCSLRPTDAAQFFFGATHANNDTVNYLIEAASPIYATTDVGKETITGYWVWPVAQGVATLGNITAGASLGTALGNTSVLTGDFLADTITNTITSDGSNGVTCVSLSSPANDVGAAYIIVRSAGAHFFRVRTDLGSGATSAWVMGRRVLPLF